MRYVLSVDMARLLFLAEASDDHVTGNWLTLQSLINRGLVEHAGGGKYRVTEAGVKVRKQLIAGNFQVKTKHE